MMEVPGGLGDALHRMFGGADDAIERAKKPLCMASKEVQDEFTAITSMGKQARRLIIEANARKELLWLKVRSDPKLSDLDHLEYDAETGMLVGCTKEEVKRCSNSRE